MRLMKWAATAAVVMAALLASPAEAQQAKPEKTDIKLAVGGKPLLYYLPLTIAERKGFFKEEGLNVEISDFAGGAKSLQALIGGSADVVTGAFDHTIQMQAKGQPITAVVLLGRYPGIVLGLTKEAAAKYKSPKDLKGMKIGVTAPGSSTNFMVNYMLAKEGLKPEDVSFIGVGGGPAAVAAMKRGELDGISNLDPVITQLERAGDIVAVADTRTTEGSSQVYGGPYPAAVLYTTPEFITKNPNTVQALTNAFVKTLKWLQTAKTEEIVAALPEEYFLGDRALYTQALERSKPTYSPDGTFTKEGAENAAKVLSGFDPAVAKAQIDLSKTYDDRFVKKALGR